MGLMLVAGDSFFDLHQQFVVGRSTVGFIVHDTIKGICAALKETFLPDPDASRWREIAQGFEVKM